jgi:hypothetical protein
MSGGGRHGMKFFWGVLVTGNAAAILLSWLDHCDSGVPRAWARFFSGSGRGMVFLACRSRYSPCR